MRRSIVFVVAALMMVTGALPVLAGDRVAEERVGVVESDRVVDRTVDRPVDRPTDHATDRPTDRRVDGVSDRTVDRVVDHRCVDFVNDRRCIDHPHVNIRHLIQRLIHAGEWEKLFRLLHRLGIV